MPCAAFDDTIVHFSLALRELLQLRSLRELDLGGRALSSSSFLSSLLQAESEGRFQSQDIFRLQVLTLRGLKLGTVAWMSLLRKRPASTAKALKDSWTPRLSGNYQPLFLSCVRSLKLIDCTQHGCVLPYLSLMTDLEELHMLSSSRDDPFAEAEQQQQQQQPSFFDRSSSPQWSLDSESKVVSLIDADAPAYGCGPPPLSSSSRRYGSSTLQHQQPHQQPQQRSQPPVIRTLDFLTLSNCFDLTLIKCDYDIEPNLEGGDDPKLSGVRAAQELMRLAAHTAAAFALAQPQDSLEIHLKGQQVAQPARAIRSRSAEPAHADMYGPEIIEID